MAATLWLIGMMGAGKSTVAPLVAAALDLEMVDTDEAVEHLSGRRIGDLFAESEAVFREFEAEVVEDLAGADAVVACGGGVVTQRDLVAVMRASGLVVWLRATVATLEARVGSGDGRPLLRDAPRQHLSSLAAQREPLYAGAAHVVIDSDADEPESVAAEVVRSWNASSAG